MRINAAKKAIIERVLRRQKRSEHSPEEVDLKDMLKGILRRANEFVPSESGSILLDDPVLDENLRKPGRLYFVACFGKGSKVIAGTSMPVSIGIAGRTYTTGKAYLSRNVSCDPNFCGTIDHLTGYRTKSLICVPVEIRGATIGVLELINRAGKKNYDGKDLTLLKIFAHYTSTLIQNSLDAKRFGELSIRDNLTGIYNDRYFFDRLSKEVRLAVLKRGDLSLIFLDLDRFKEVNDTHGHLAGSQLLREVGAIVRSLVGQNVVPVRYGGDEFTLILPGTDIKEATRVAEDLRRAIEGFTFLENRVPGKVEALRIRGLITASIGVASLEKNIGGHGGTRRIGDALIKAADTAMYLAKQNGKNRVVKARGVFTVA